MKFARLMAAKAVGSRYLRAVTLRGDRPDEALEVGRLVGEQALCRDEALGEQVVRGATSPIVATGSWPGSLVGGSLPVTASTRRSIDPHRQGIQRALLQGRR
jgi:hypothetical protein